LDKPKKQKRMKIHFFLVLLGVASCKGQSNGTSPNNNEAKPQASQPAATKPDIDPYWVAPHDIISPYGPQSITRNMLQAKGGNMWFASWEGIVLYDGKSLALGKPYGAPIIWDNSPGGQVFGIVEDNDGNTLFGREGGVYKYHPAAARIVNKI